MRTKLTPSFVKTATAIDGKDRTIFWDQAMSGFGLMVTAAGSRSYVVQYRAGRSSRRLTIDYDSLSLDEARKQARMTLGSVAKGGDPLAERRAKLAEGADTFQSITEEYLAREVKSCGPMRSAEPCWNGWCSPRSARARSTKSNAVKFASCWIMSKTRRDRRRLILCWHS